jgi:GT2 family glycosyltransferase
MSAVRVAVITPVAGRHEHLQRQRHGLLAGTRPPDMHVVVAMDDPAIRDVLGAHRPHLDVVDLPCSRGRFPLARARNLGAERALAADADLLVFLDVDCIPGARMLQRYAEYASGAAPGLLCGPVSYLPPLPSSQGYDEIRLAAIGQPHPARPVPPETGAIHNGDHHLFWSLSFAVRESLWRDLGGFCEDYEGYGCEDTDFGQVAAQRDVPLIWLGGAWAYHQHHPTTDPPVQHIEDILRNAAVFFRRWGWWPMSGWLDAFERQGLVRYHEGTQRWILVDPR